MTDDYYIPIESNVTPLTYDMVYHRDYYYRDLVYMVEVNNYLSNSRKRNDIAKLFELADLEGLMQTQFFCNEYIIRNEYIYIYNK